MSGTSTGALPFESVIFYSMDDWNSWLFARGGERETVFDAFAESLKALANGRRLELLEILAQGEHSVEDLARLSGMALTTTSSHLQTLKRTGLVKTRRERTTIHYRLAGDDVAALFTAAKKVALAKHPRMRDVLDDYLGDDATVPIMTSKDIEPRATVLDVRPREEFEAGHFSGAVSIPLPELEERLHELSFDAPVVIYCRGQLCRFAHEATALLRSRGFDAQALAEGVIEWRGTEGIDLEAA